MLSIGQLAGTNTSLFYSISLHLCCNVLDGPVSKVQVNHAVCASKPYITTIVGVKCDISYKPSRISSPEGMLCKCGGCIWPLPALSDP